MTQLIPTSRALKFVLGTLLFAGLVPVSALMVAQAKDSNAAPGKKEAPVPKVKTLPKSVNPVPPSEAKPVFKHGSTNQAKGGAQRVEKADAPLAPRPKSKDAGKTEKPKVEAEVEKIVARLTTSQKTKLLSLLNTAESEELLGIAGVGKSRCAAIEKARPIASVEGLREIKGLGLKTFGDLIDHGKTLSESRSKSGSTSKASTKASSSRSKKEA